MKNAIFSSELGVFIGMIEHHPCWSYKDNEHSVAILIDDEEVEKIAELLMKHFNINNLEFVEIETDKNFMLVSDIEKILSKEVLLSVV